MRFGLRIRDEWSYELTISHVQNRNTEFSHDPLSFRFCLDTIHRSKQHDYHVTIALHLHSPVVVSQSRIATVFDAVRRHTPLIRSATV